MILNIVIYNKEDYYMIIKEAKKEILKAIKTYLLKDDNGNNLIPLNRQRPIALMGPAGIGKTDIIYQIAQELEIGFLSYTITHHTRQSVVGLPKIVSKSYSGTETLITEYTMSEIISSVYDEIEKAQKKDGILFIDEFNCVSETLAPTMLQFLQNKTFGNHKLPDGWKIILAGNPPEYNRSVKELDAVTLDRLRIIHIEPDYGSWKEYATLKNLHPSIIAYLSQKNDHLCLFSTTKGEKQIVTPRGWEELSHSIYTYEKLGLEISFNLVSQFLQSNDVSMEFSNYYILLNTIISNHDMNSILKGELKKDVKEKLKKYSFDIQYAIVWILTNRLMDIASNFMSTTNICDEVYPLFKDSIALKSLDPFYKADVNSDTKIFLRKALEVKDKISYEDTYEKIKSDFNDLINSREEYKNTTDLYTTNILEFIKTTFGIGGILEMFLTNISVNSNIVSLLIETKNIEYKNLSEYFSGVNNPLHLKNRAAKF